MADAVNPPPRGRRSEPQPRTTTRVADGHMQKYALATDEQTNEQTDRHNHHIKTPLYGGGLTRT